MSWKEQIEGIYYKPLEPYMTGRLDVSTVHTLYFEQCGNPDGWPVLIVHGGPGGGSSPLLRRFFDPAAYRMVLVDQRGTGRSTPSGELQENTTQDLARDFEKVRREVGGVETWAVVLGGSWGSCLALCYAETFPERVGTLCLVSVFLGTRKETESLFEADGHARLFYPDGWEEYTAPISNILQEYGEKSHVKAYQTSLASSDDALATECARSWTRWEMGASTLLPDPELEVQKQEQQEQTSGVSAAWTAEFLLRRARIQIHYLANNCFLEDGQLLAGVEQLRKHDIKCVIIHGRYDMVCPPVTAWSLHKKWPGSDLRLVAGTGHMPWEPGLAEAIVKATNELRDRIQGNQ